MELKKLFNHEIVVSPTNNAGIIVKIGCGTFCYSEPEPFLDDLEEYLKDHPEEDKALPIGFEARTEEDAKRMAIAFADSVS